MNLTLSKWCVPFALVLGACSSGGDENTPRGGGTTDGAPMNGTGGAAAGTGGSAAGGSPTDGGAGSGGTGTGGSSGTSTGGSAGTGLGGGPPFKCADPLPNVTAPPAAWANATGNLANMASECGNLGMVSADPCSDLVIAGVAHKGLWGTQDGGKTWTGLGTGSGSAVITNRISALVYDPDHEGTFYESGIYNGGGVYKTTDDGTTFEQLGNVTHNDSVSVDFTDVDRKTLLAGPHESTSKLFLSKDSGQTWNDVGAGLPASSGYCTATLVLGATNLLVGCQGNGIFHSSDGSVWTSVHDKGVIEQPLVAGDGTIYWLGSQGGINVSTDHGQHFTQTADGSVAPAIIGTSSPVELPDGRIVVVGTDHLQISADRGNTWKPIGEPLPWPGGGYNGARGPAYSARTKTFYVWRWDCGNAVLPDAIMSAGFDYTKE